MALGEYVTSLQITKRLTPVDEWASVSAVKGGLGTNRNLVWTMTDDVNYVTLAFRVPDLWKGNNNIGLTLHWSGYYGSVIADTETVVWELAWQLNTGRNLRTGTLTVDTATYTQAGAGVAAELIDSISFALDKDDVDNAYAVGDILGIRLRPLSAGSTYDGGVFSVHFLGATMDWG